MITPATTETVLHPTTTLAKHTEHGEEKDATFVVDKKYPHPTALPPQKRWETLNRV
ncbi:hypothetical protein R6G85_00490 [Actinotignum urinale]|uniref:hypothetical protein n=1 Tax=Actinotignum urinale TaxID=190146 RepID=UPI002A82ECA3|nr:hypothetical protein [Actinotignum urinale]MDY5150970.1 hypothetical protein [Actinotignum urinale]